ncbi:hypothetical protein C475_04840 [Halosimplex carlsbadense 2-9-1]|uniref:Uncharacterized protein n=1 Tax=Halosimplex carlsbadense 2-9-1 TaxID=797114 RepID=M0CZR1_9EURY|nr:hypothetical protein [Halosimplex carlsbadense]ELZ28103.1 hypothetical protein C475_04840 [Halosimplex carlsbadense 2-9-1]
MDEFLYAYYVLDEEPSAALASDMLEFVSGHAETTIEAGTADEVDPAELLDNSITFDLGGVEYHLSLDSATLPQFDGVPAMEIQVYGTHFQERYAGSPDAREHTERLINLLRDTYLSLRDHGHEIRCVHAFGPSDVASLLDGRVTVPDAQVSGNAFDAVYWLHILPPYLVEIVGADRLHEAPAWLVEKLADGSVMLVVDDRPDRGGAEGTDLFSDVVAHLGIDDEAYMPD